MTKAKADIILDLVLSLNAGDSYYVNQRVDIAIEQYNMLVKRGIIKEEKTCREEKLIEDINKLFRPPVGPL